MHASEPFLDRATIVKRLQPAPYDGVLLKEDAYRFYVNTKDSCDFTDKALDSCHAAIASNGGEIISATTLLSFILGAATMYYVTH